MQDNLLRIKRPARVLVYLSLMVLSAEAQTPEAQIRIATIYGQVFLPDRQPAAFMPVHIWNSSGYGADTTTDEEGNYRFEEVPMAQIQFKVNPPKESPYYDATVTFTITREIQNNFRVNIFIVKSTVVVDKNEKAATVISAKEAGQHVPSAAQKAYKKGKKYRGQKKFKEALNELDAAIRLYPDYFQAIAERGNVLVSTGHAREALTEFNKALQIVSSYEPALSGAGFCLLSMGEFEQAIGMLEQAIHINPSHTQNLLYLGIANVVLSRWSKAQEALEMALKRDKERMTSAHLYLAFALAGQQLYSRAADEMHTYLTLNPNAPNGGRLQDTEAQWRSKVARGRK